MSKRDELVEKMLEAWYSRSGFQFKAGRNIPTPDEIKRMSAALRVVLDEVLGELSDDECVYHCLGQINWEVANKVLAARRKSFEEPPDPAIEAMKAAIVEQAREHGYVVWDSNARVDYARIIAAIDKARAQ